MVLSEKAVSKISRLDEQIKNKISSDGSRSLLVLRPARTSLLVSDGSETEHGRHHASLTRAV